MKKIKKSCSQILALINLLQIQQSSQIPQKGNSQNFYQVNQQLPIQQSHQGEKFLILLEQDSQLIQKELQDQLPQDSSYQYQVNFLSQNNLLQSETLSSVTLDDQYGYYLQDLRLPTQFIFQ
ncbi:hypothetical protein ABPG72_001006 [Tetrahymena utriculariae]